MDTADVLRRKRAKLAGQIEFIDELLAEMGRAEDAGGDGPKVFHPPALVPQGEPRPVEEPRAAAPKAERPAAGARPPAPTWQAVAEALLGGPRAMAALATHFGVHPTTVGAVLRENPKWFRKVGAGPMTRWELTEAGRAAGAAAP